MPFDDFTWSARSLDRHTLGKQRADTLQVMYNLIHGDLERPVVQMWEGHERALLAYQQAVCYEWTAVHGFSDSYWDKTRIMFLDVVVDPMSVPLIPPSWMGNVNFHAANQSKLLRINPKHYSKQFPGMPNDIPFVWPNGTIGEY